MGATFNPFTGKIDFTGKAVDISGLANRSLSNLSSVAINTSLISDTDSTDSIGSSPIKWAHVYTDDIEMVNGGTIRFRNSGNTTDNVTISHSTNNLAFTGSSGASNGYSFDNTVKATSDSAVNLGSSSTYWANTYTDKLFLNSTAAIDGATAGFNTFTGGLSGGTATTDSLNLYANSATFASTNTGKLNIKHGIQWDTDFTFSLTASPPFFKLWDYIFNNYIGTYTVPATGNIGQAVVMSAGFTLKTNNNQIFSSVQLFSATPIIEPTVSGSNQTDSSSYYRMYFAAPQLLPAISTANTWTGSSYGGFVSAPAIGIKTGSHASAAVVMPTVNSYLSLGSVGAQTTVTEYNHYGIIQVTNSGTLTTQIGLNIPNMTSATTNIGVKNASTTVNVPATAQNITAAGTALTITSTTKQITANASYTLTATPTIADGQDGQVVTIINVDTADTITLQDQGTLAGSNLRLTNTTVALAPRQSIKLMYSSTVGDWVQVGNLVTVI